MEVFPLDLSKICNFFRINGIGKGCFKINYVSLRIVTTEYYTGEPQKSEPNESCVKMNCRHTMSYKRDAENRFIFIFCGRITINNKRLLTCYRLVTFYY